MKHTGKLIHFCKRQSEDDSHQYSYLVSLEKPASFRCDNVLTGLYPKGMRIKENPWCNAKIGLEVTFSRDGESGFSDFFSFKKVIPGSGYHRGRVSYSLGNSRDYLKNGSE